MPSILVTGATGYVGGRLVPELLAAGHRVRCLARTPAKLADAPWRDRVEVVQGDVDDAGSLARAFEGIDVAYHLIHSMGGPASFEEADRRAAASIASAAQEAGVRRLVYLGGLGRDDDPTLSRHLRSRHEVGRVLAAGTVPVTELRAAIIIGSGSASFEMLRYLVEVLPVMVAPRWVASRCQPIAIRDVLAWLVAAVDDTGPGHQIREIGGPDVLTYREMMAAYAEVAGLRHRLVIGVPFLSPRLSSLWVSLVTPLPSGLARPLVGSLINDVVVTRPPPTPPEGMEPLGFADAVDLALQRSAALQVTTRWSDASLPGRSPAEPMPTDPDWSGGSLLVDEQEVTSAAGPEAVFAAITRIGGDGGWFVTPLLWRVRGWIDKLMGGVGMRRGRRHPSELGIGDAVDLWRVEAIERPALLRLRAEMRLPGVAWLEWRVAADDAGSRLTQRAIFVPRGLWGRAYWYGLMPFHGLIFGRLARRIADVAAEPPMGTAPSAR